MLSRWRSGRILLRKKTRLLKQGLFLFFYGLACTNDQCNGANIYFGHKDRVYVIHKQLTIDVFGMCVDGYVEKPKGHVNKSLVVQALQSCRLTPAKFFANQWNAKSLDLPYSIKYPTIIYVIYQKEKV